MSPYLLPDAQLDLASGLLSGTLYLNSGFAIAKATAGLLILERWSG